MEFEPIEIATSMLGLNGFELVASSEEGGELHLLVETKRRLVACQCGTRAGSHGRRLVTVRDLPISGRPSVIGWKKRIFRCGDPDCDVTTFSEQSDEIAPRASLTRRAREEICRRVGEDAASVAQIARDFGIAWETAWRAAKEVGIPMVESPDRVGGVEALGLDESSFLKAKPDRATSWVTGFCDLERSLLIDVVENRSAASVAAWLACQDSDWLFGISVVALDPHAGYLKGLKSRLGHVTFVLDHFHVIRLANQAIDDVRRRVQQSVLGHRGRKGDPLYSVRKILLVASERLTERGLERLLTAFASPNGDPGDEVAATYLGKELLREVYAADGLTDALEALGVFYDWTAKSGIPELKRLARTVARWEPEILAYHRTGLSNGPMEALNSLIKKIKRIGHGFRNFENYRLRLLLHCGVEWNTHRTVRLRSRKPRLVA